MITCPKKDCLSEIDNDSVYCDQCGSALKECPKCGEIYISNFCIKDGSKTIPRILPGEINPAFSPPVLAVNEGSTIRFQPAGKFELQSIEDGFNLNIESGDLLGRDFGKHSAILSKYSYISGKHAEFRFENNQWNVMDLNSTNFTYINGKKIPPAAPFPVKNGDTIVFADKSFKVKII